ncbi:ABC transporter substrate-binding protein [Thalassobacillus hwangdonensis]|uniref:ABC transporter substrate-binding protein n=1 Tax=Thalassobacillus hwangdonensis TaxID=546108 RepID=A0ABW3L2A3_9BACI
MKKILYSFLAVLLMLTGWSSFPVQANGDQLRLGISSDESTMNPYTYITGSPGLDLVSLMYDNLFQLDADNEPQPWLVKEYTVSEDGLNYDFVLHDNVTFHDGEALTTEDVAFTIQYFLDYPKSRFTNPLKSISNVEVASDTEISLTLEQAEPDFMIQPLSDLPILPEHIWSEIDNPDESDNNIGSGPYKMDGYKSGEFYRMTANEDYFKGEPTVKELVFPIIEDTTALFTALQSGEIDAMSATVSPELVEQFENSSNVKLARGSGFSTTLLQMNAEKYPLSETEFRKAISYAIDEQELIDTVLLGYAEVGSPGFIHPSSPVYNSDLQSEHDIEKAKQLLADAGFEDTNGDGFVEGKDGEEISLEMLVYSNSSIRIRTAEIIAEWLNDAGIQTSVRAMDMTTVDSLVWPEFDVSKGRDFDLAMWGWSSTMQLFPSRIVELFHSDPAIGSVNIGGYSNEEFDQLAEKLQNTVDAEERKSILMDLQQLVAEEAPIIPLSYQEIINAYNSQVYDDYTFQVGKGIVNKLSFVNVDGFNEGANEDSGDDDESEGNVASAAEKDDENSAEASASDVNSSTEKNNATLWILGAVVLLVAGGLFFMKRRSSKT